MTDKQIIKALEGSISNAKSIDCKVWTVDVCKLEKALDLINRQKAEIERLQGLLSEWKTEAYKLADSKDEYFKTCDEYAEKAKQRYGG